jgi:hypothetical protein
MALQVLISVEIEQERLAHLCNSDGNSDVMDKGYGGRTGYGTGCIISTFGKRLRTSMIMLTTLLLGSILVVGIGFCWHRYRAM